MVSNDLSRQKDSREKIIVLHKMQEMSIGEYQGQVKLIDPETGEVLHELKPQRFNRCNEIFAAYKLLINSIRFIAKCGYTHVLLDTNVGRFADEVQSQEVSRTLQRQLAERCVINGIDKIQVI